MRPIGSSRGWVGNQMEAQDILQLGVVHDAFSVHEKNEIFQRLTSGQMSTSLTQHHLAQHHQLHTPRNHKFAAATAARSFSTPNDTQSTLLSNTSTLSTTTASPVRFATTSTNSSGAVAAGGSSSLSNGFLTASKLPRSDKAAVMTTPSLSSRPPSVAQTTSRKAQSTTSRFFKFGTAREMGGMCAGVTRP